MKTFESKSSTAVTTITIVAVIAMIFFISTMALGLDKYGLAPTIIFTSVIVLLIFYFYANSADKILLDNDKLIIKKKYGRLNIEINKIQKAERLAYSNLTMTAGSKGLFGFIGGTMDNSYSYVKDRSKMIQIIIPERKIIFSCENPDDLVSRINELKMK